MKKPVLVIGGGGHGKVVIDALLCSGRRVSGVVDPALTPGDTVLTVPVLGNDEKVYAQAPDSILLANGIGATARTHRRRDVYERFVALGFRFVNVVHPAATIGITLPANRGIQVMAGAVVQPGTILGENVLLNTKASVDHDCEVGDHVHVGPGATICGGVLIERGAFIGAGAVIVPGVRIGADAVVGAGSVVLENVEAGTTVVGVPARVIRR